MMQAVGSRELKNRLGTYLRRVREGVTILVTDHGRPVAELRPISESSTDLEEKLGKLAAQGLVTLRRRKGLVPFEPLSIEGKPVSETVIEGREDRF